MVSREIAIVQEWHNALNTIDKEQLAALVKKDVQIRGPRGREKGVHLLLEWVDRAQVTLTPKRYFKKDSVVVVEELGEWHDPQTGAITGMQTVTSVFTLTDFLISGISRYASLEEALNTAGLNEEHEIKV
ncbi:hypothetical protein AHMF7605_14485 [Adhaeribacter arboris]|uniref:Nuclear transport factor 2 family protein n=2 Tax=Adhaeribacter arboris TaxID=2072846 RepID=A0A2T2YGM9_9BACT|nr:hypothetical protein AHMF7605_14485 [Adhaeribacter arboris]